MQGLQGKRSFTSFRQGKGITKGARKKKGIKRFGFPRDRGKPASDPPTSFSPPSGAPGLKATPVRIRLSHSCGLLLPVSSPSGTVEPTPSPGRQGSRYGELPLDKEVRDKLNGESNAKPGSSLPPGPKGSHRRGGWPPLWGRGGDFLPQPVISRT